MYWLIIAITLSVIAIILAVLIVSSLVLKRSFMATVVALYLRIANPRISDKRVIKGLKDLPKKNDVPFLLPKSIKRKYSVTEQTVCGIQTLVFDQTDVGEKAVIYLHGGGYVRQPRLHHLKFLGKLSKTVCVTVVAPIYPKAPNHSAQEVYPMLTDLYEHYLKKYPNIVLMGDSSGGGLALGLCEDFLIKGIIQPEKLILLSPWVDISLTNKDLALYEKKDPLIWASAERIWGKVWAKDLPVDDYRVSPLFGSVNGLKDVTIFVGDREMLYPENLELYKKLTGNGVNARLVIGRAMNHVYPIYPIREAHFAICEIAKTVNAQKET